MFLFCSHAVKRFSAGQTVAAESQARGGRGAMEQVEHRSIGYAMISGVI
jgi:hypothetical protein